MIEELEHLDTFLTKKQLLAATESLLQVSTTNAIRQFSDSTIVQSSMDFTESMLSHHDLTLQSRYLEAKVSAQKALKLALFMKEWKSFTEPWSPQTKYYSDLLKLNHFLENPKAHQSNSTARLWTCEDEKQVLFQYLYVFEESLMNWLVSYTDQAKKISINKVESRNYFRTNWRSMAALCLLLDSLIESEVIALPDDRLSRLQWLSKKCGVTSRQSTR